MNSADKKELMDLFDERYVRKNDCSERHKETDEKINEISIMMAKNTTQLGILMKLGYVTIGALITLLATQLGSLIFK